MLVLTLHINCFFYSSPFLLVLHQRHVVSEVILIDSNKLPRALKVFYCHEASHFSFPFLENSCSWCHLTLCHTNIWCLLTQLSGFVLGKAAWELISQTKILSWECQESTWQTDSNLYFCTAFHLPLLFVAFVSLPVRLKLSLQMCHLAWMGNSSLLMAFIDIVG